MNRILAYVLMALALAALVAGTTVRAPALERNEAYRAFSFVLELDGAAVGTFSEVSGLSSETEVVEFRDADGSVRLIPGETRYGPIVLRRGITGDMSLWEWRQMVEDGKEARKSGSIVMYDQAHKPVARWHFENGWPSKIEIGSLKAGAGEVLMESVTIVCERLQRVSP